MTVSSRWLHLTGFNRTPLRTDSTHSLTIISVPFSSAYYASFSCFNAYLLFVIVNLFETSDQTLQFTRVKRLHLFQNIFFLIVFILYENLIYFCRYYFLSRPLSDLFSYDSQSFLNRLQTKIKLFCYNYWSAFN